MTAGLAALAVGLLFLCFGLWGWAMHAHGFEKGWQARARVAHEMAARTFVGDRLKKVVRQDRLRAVGAGT